MEISFEEIRNSIRQLDGMPVAHTWKSVGSCIFLDLGKLQERSFGRKQFMVGEVTITIEWNWRIENAGQIVFGSSNSGPAIENGIKRLIGQSITSINIEGEIPELVIRFSNGDLLRSMAMLSGNPQWSIRQIDKTYISWVNGKAIRRNGDESIYTISEAETKNMDFIEKVVNRWGTPLLTPKNGNCRDCRYFIRLDGDFYLLDYGVCINGQSGFDGRAVNTASGCPSYSAEYLELIKGS